MPEPSRAPKPKLEYTIYQAAKQLADKYNSWHGNRPSANSDSPLSSQPAAASSTAPGPELLLPAYLQLRIGNTQTALTIIADATATIFGKTTEQLTVFRLEGGRFAGLYTTLRSCNQKAAFQLLASAMLAIGTDRKDKSFLLSLVQNAAEFWQCLGPKETDSFRTLLLFETLLSPGECGLESRLLLESGFSSAKFLQMSGQYGNGMLMRRDLHFLAALESIAIYGAAHANSGLNDNHLPAVVEFLKKQPISEEIVRAVDEFSSRGLQGKADPVKIGQAAIELPPAAKILVRLLYSGSKDAGRAMAFALQAVSDESVIEGSLRRPIAKCYFDALALVFRDGSERELDDTIKAITRNSNLHHALTNEQSDSLRQAFSKARSERLKKTADSDFKRTVSSFLR